MLRYVNLIKSFYPSFSKQEKKVAEFIISQKSDISIMSLQEISKKIEVSEATIVRFVRKIGYKGFPEFKLEIARNYNSYKKYKAVDYVEKIKENIIESLNDTFGFIKKEDVDKAVKFIEKSKNLYFFGLGASGVAAEEMQNRFMRYGKLGHSVNDSHFQVMYSSVCTKEDVIVVISLSGETIDLIYPLNIAKERGCKIIAITNYILSPIAKLSDVVLVSSSKETPLDGGSLISKITQLYIIDILATKYAINNSKKAEKIKTVMATSIANKNQGEKK